MDTDIWWESSSLAGFFPIGECAGTFGVYRPGGTALNATQVGAMRAALKISREKPRDEGPDEKEIARQIEELVSYFDLLSRPKIRLTREDVLSLRAE